MNINMRSIILIAIALIVAGTAAFLARSLVSTPEGEQTAAVQQAPSNAQVLVANKPIPTGFFLKREDLIWQQWPSDNININYVQITSENEAESWLEEVLGAVVKTPITAGEPIVNGQIAKPGDRGFMAAVITPGNRAISININSKSGISGFIFPGDSVDILLTHTVNFEDDGQVEQSQVTETVLKNIRVLAIDTQMNNATNTPAIGKVATFEVTPKQAEKVALMGRMGELSLSLRSLAVESAEDETVAAAMSSTEKTITYANEISVVVAANSGVSPAAKKKRKVKVIRANTVQDLTFTDPGIKR